MARTRGSYNFSQNFEVFRTAPLDARQKVQYYSDLVDPSTWVDSNGYVWLYKGALVVVTEDPSSGLWWLQDPANYQNYSSWLSVASVQDISTGGNTGIYNTTLDPSLEMPNPVGGIPAGTSVSDLKGDTFITLFDDLLFPTVNPTYVNPSNSFSDNVGPYEEIGTSVDITFNSSFDRGAINISGNFQNYRSGLPNTYIYTGTGISGSVFSTSLTDSSILTGYTVLIGVQSWTNTVSYDSGPQPYDNKGNPYGSPLSAGTTSAKTVSFEGVYPIYATLSSISNPDEKLLPLNYSMLNGNNIQISLPSESGGFKQSFDIPDAWIGAPTNRPLQGIEQYDSNFDVWNAISLGTFTQSSVSHGVGYKRYTYNGATIGNRLIRLKF